MNLSAKQKLFCQGVASGLSQTQAYINAGYSKIHADGAASRMSGKDSIREYIVKLQQPAEDALRLNATIVHERLYDLATRHDVSPADNIRAMAEYNKMVGGYEPEKIEISPLQKILDDIRGSKD